MVEKKLNYNQPILSVRKYSQKPDASLHPGSGPIRNPGAVPFHWERAPGQPKELIKQQKIEADSLSTESFVSSSRSSLSGMDDQDPDSSGSFSGDSRSFMEVPQTHEVVMDTEKKRSSEVRNEIVSQDKAAFWYRPTFARSCSDYKDKQADDRDRNENLIGVLPRSCLKSSVGVLNPLPAAFYARTRLLMFQGRSGLQCASSSSTDSSSETEDTVKAAARTDELKEKKSINRKNGVIGSRSKSFKTLQELLEDEDYRRRRKALGNNVERKQITTLQHFPLPRSPSDSWLCRTLPSVRASNPAFASRFANKS